MLTRATIVRLVVFAVISVLGIGYTWYQYAGGSRVIGNTTYLVKLHLASGGGIFSNGEVTYRGVRVGEVGQLRLTPDGVVVDLHIRRSAPPIPANTKAAVHDLSAVGEQYVDLRPTGRSGPSLESLPLGERTIEQQDATTPVPIQDVVNNLDQLSRSVPEQSLRTVVRELDKAFAGTGGDLQRLLDSANSFTKAAGANLPQTVRLLDTSRTVLDTQNDEAAALKSFSRSLQQLAAQLKTSDPDLRRVISAAPPAAHAVDNVLRESGRQLSVVLANLLTTSNLLAPRTSGLELALVVYPLVPPAVRTVIPGDGTAHLGLPLNFFNPPPCVRGYQGTNRRPGSATTPAKPNYQAYCAEPTGSPISVRGSQNAPYRGVPATAKPGGSPGDGGRVHPDAAALGSRGGPFDFPLLGGVARVLSTLRN